jgi:hypothetical protein
MGHPRQLPRHRTRTNRRLTHHHRITAPSPPRRAEAPPTRNTYRGMRVGNYPERLRVLARAGQATPVSSLHPAHVQMPMRRPSSTSSFLRRVRSMWLTTSRAPGLFRVGCGRSVRLSRLLREPGHGRRGSGRRVRHQPSAAPAAGPARMHQPPDRRYSSVTARMTRWPASCGRPSRIGSRRVHQLRHRYLPARERASSMRCRETGPRLKMPSIGSFVVP